MVHAMKLQQEINKQSTLCLEAVNIKMSETLSDFLNSVCKYLWIFLDFILWLIVLPGVLPLIVLFASYKCLVKALLAVAYKNAQFVTANDLPVARATLEDKPIVDIGFILEVDGNIELEELKEKFSSCFLETPTLPVPNNPLYRLHCTFSSFMGYLCTTRVPFDIAQQIRAKTLNVPVNEFFASWFQSPYSSDNNLPRWELVLAKPMDSNEKSYIGFRVHHGLMDGLGLMWILDQLCDLQSEHSEGKRQPILTRFLFHFRLLLALPRELVIFLYKGIKYSWSTRGQTLCQTNEASTRSNQQFLLSWSSGPLSPVKTVRRKLQVPFSTLLYTVQSTAVRMYLEDCRPELTIPKRVPVIHTIAKPNHPMSTLKNHWTLVKFYTPLAERDVLRSLQQTTEEYQTFLDRGLHISGPSFISEFMNIFPTKWCLYNVSSPLSTYQLALSNTIRSYESYGLLGNKVKDIHHVFCTKDLCPDAVLYTTTASQNDILDATHSGSNVLFPSQKEMDLFASVYWPKAIQELVDASQLYEHSQELTQVVAKK